MEFHRSAFKHDLDRRAILHAVANAITVVDLDLESDPPKVLAIGADPAGNLLEVVWLDLRGGTELVIHAMPLRPAFHPLLPAGGEEL